MTKVIQESPVCRHHLIIHRDLKPANLLLGGIPYCVIDRSLAQRFGTCKIADFGLCKSLALRNAPSTHSARNLASDSLGGNGLIRAVQADRRDGLVPVHVARGLPARAVQLKGMMTVSSLAGKPYDRVMTVG